jgi:hypothetical protein
MRHIRTITRRRFLKNSLLLASAPMICPFPIFGEEAPSNRMNLALIGCGTMGADNDLKAALGCGANIIAVCDVDESMARNAILAGGAQTQGTAIYGDYRKLLDKEKTLDGVIIATPDHWHAAICEHYLRADRHVYCEKPLTRTIGEARGLRTLARASKSVTQMGNQGSAFGPMRRGMEVIQAGALGTLRSAHVVAPNATYPTGVNRPAGEDPVPKGLDWDFWVGPSPMRPYKTDIYHPRKWKAWHDFGTGQIGNWGAHSLNLPVRALNLGYPDTVEVSGQGFGFESYWTGGTITFHFPTSLQGAPFTAYWYENLPTPEAFRGLPPTDEGTTGLVLIGDRGRIYTNSHNGHVVIKLEGESGWKDILHHEATRLIPVTLPRVQGHMQEWIDACKGGPKTFSNFEFASRMTETLLLGLLATELGHGFEYDAENQRVIGASTDELINSERRTKWLAS